MGLFTRRHSRQTSRRQFQYRGPGLTELLEVRSLLTTYTVNTLLDEPSNGSGVTDGLVSLREAIQAANTNAIFGDAAAGSSSGQDVIQFDASLSGSTLTLNSLLPQLTGEIAIIGLGADKLTISGNGTYRVFWNNGTAEISDLTIANGNSDRGGGVRNFGTILLNRVELTGNNASTTSDDSGGGFWSTGTATIMNSTFSSNTSAGSGGGVWSNGRLHISNSTFSNNRCSYFGGGIYTGKVYGGISQTTVVNSTFSDNVARKNTGYNTYAGGGVAYEGTNSITMSNCILTGNTQGTGNWADDLCGIPIDVDIDFFDYSTGTGSNNLIGAADYHRGFVHGVNGNQLGVSRGDVISSSLADNGGTTRTYSLVAGSLALDAGNHLVAIDNNGDPLTTDQRGTGILRIQGDAVDIGAFEVTPMTINVTTLDDELDPTYDSSDMSLREAVYWASQYGGPQTITFSNALEYGTIHLTSTIMINEAITIRNQNNISISIDGGNSTRLFYIDLDNAGGEVVFENLSLENGSSENGNGGAIFNLDADLILFNMNMNFNVGFKGGAVYSASDLWVTGSSFLGNRASANGGALFVSGHLTAENSLFYGNGANLYGGAIRVDGNAGGASLISNSTVSNNFSSLAGGGIFNTNENLTIRNSTITANKGYGDFKGNGQFGGGIYTFENANASTTLFNTIVAGNYGSYLQVASDIGNKLLTLGSSHNIIGDTATAGGLTDGTNGNHTGIPVVDILDLNLSDNGGATWSHALLQHSIALNSGDNTQATGANDNPLTTDQRGSGFTRILDGTVDIGAFEGFRLASYDLSGFTNGSWWVSRTNIYGNYTTSFAARGPASSFRQVLYGDFNGDQRRDVAVWLNNGDWQIGLLNLNNEYVFSKWTNWQADQVKEVHVGDFNHDGRDDLIGLFRNGTQGQWYAGLSTGSRFENHYWGMYGNYDGIKEVLVGDFDGKWGDDLAIVANNGTIWVLNNTRTGFSYVKAGRWGTGGHTTQVGDYDGDGRDDLLTVFGLAGYRSIMVMKATGSASFNISLWAGLTTTQSLDALVTGDFDGDSKDDIAAVVNGSRVWVGLSQANRFTMQFWTNWGHTIDGMFDLHVGNTNNDNKADLISRDGMGFWRTAESTGTGFGLRHLTRWSEFTVWQYVLDTPYSPLQLDAPLPAHLPNQQDDYEIFGSDSLQLILERL
ncbi:MAG: hypothetical protein KDA78_09655 [Planctomycetaceae bacterium]|nr:hypothetical protein [Planctomycetaceae bacterium]